MKIFTFYAIEDEESRSIDTATILAIHLNEAIELCKKHFIPESYHEIELQTVVDLKSHYQFHRHPKPIMLRNNDDLKEI